MVILEPNGQIRCRKRSTRWSHILKHLALTSRGAYRARRQHYQSSSVTKATRKNARGDLAGVQANNSTSRSATRRQERAQLTGSPPFRRAAACHELYEPLGDGG